MDQLDKMKFTQILHKLSNVYPKDITKDLLNAFWDALSGYHIDSVDEAVKHIISTKTDGFYPVPGEIIRVINQSNQYRNNLLSEPEPTEEDKLKGKYELQLIGHLSRYAKRRKIENGKIIKQNPFKRWKKASNPIFRFEWFKKHTDMPEYMLKKLEEEL